MFDNYRLRLEAELSELRAKVVAFLKQSNKASFAITANKLEELSNAELVDFAVKLDFSQLDQELYRFKRIDAALCQLEIGMYGLCSDCEEEIEVSRLDNDPTTQRCQACADKYRARSRGKVSLAL